MADGSENDGPAFESDFSPRKLKVALVCLIGMTFATSILPFAALGWAMKPMIREFGWSPAELGLAGAFLVWFGALTVWGLGRMTDKLGARPIILIGTIAVGAVTLAIGRVQNLWQLYALFALLGAFGSSAASYTKVIASLFTRNRGKAMAIFAAAGAAMHFLFPAAAIFLIAHYGWRGTFLAFGLATLAVVPVLYFGMEEPGTAGQLPTIRVGARPAARADAPVRRIELEGMTMGRILRDRAFWLVLFGASLAAIVGNTVLFSSVAAMMDKGFAAETTMGAMKLAAPLGICGTLLGGYLLDRFQTAKVAIPFALATALGYLLLMIVTPQQGGQPMLLAAVGLGSFAFSAALPMNGYFITRLFGLRSFAEIIGFQAAVQAILMAFAGPLTGRIHDLTGAYDLAFQIGIGAALVAAAVYLALPRYRFSADIGAMPAKRNPTN